jgi:hypothetical protein
MFIWMEGIGRSDSCVGIKTEGIGRTVSHVKIKQMIW